MFSPFHGHSTITLTSIIDLVYILCVVLVFSPLVHYHDLDLNHWPSLYFMCGPCVQSFPLVQYHDLDLHHWPSLKSNFEYVTHCNIFACIGDRVFIYDMHNPCGIYSTLPVHAMTSSLYFDLPQCQIYCCARNHSCITVWFTHVHSLRYKTGCWLMVCVTEVQEVRLICHYDTVNEEIHLNKSRSLNSEYTVKFIISFE